MSDPLENYVANLLREKGVPDSAGARSELLARVNDAIDQALVEALSDEQLSTLEAAAKEASVSMVINRRIGNLSKGYIQRTGLAAALLGACGETGQGKAIVDNCLLEYK